MFLFGSKIFDSGTNCNFKFFKTETHEEFVGEKNGLPIKLVITKYIVKYKLNIEFFILNSAFINKKIVTKMF